MVSFDDQFWSGYDVMHPPIFMPPPLAPSPPPKKKIKNKNKNYNKLKKKKKKKKSFFISNSFAIGG